VRKFPAVLACVVLLSFASVSSAQSSMSSGGSEKEKIEALYKTYVKAFQNKDVSAIMSFYDPQELFVFDVSPPREYPSWDAYKKDWEALFAAMPGPMEINMSELAVTVVGPVAYTRKMQSGYFTAKDGSKTELAVRVTDVLRKTKGKWLIVQEHVSVPVDLATGKADLMSKP